MKLKIFAIGVGAIAFFGYASMLLFPEFSARHMRKLASVYVVSTVTFFVLNHRIEAQEGDRHDK